MPLDGAEPKLDRWGAERMLAAGVVAVVILILVATAFFSRWRWKDPQQVHLAAFEAILTMAALLSAGVWYFIARPDAPKMRFEQNLAGYALPDHKVLITSELVISNVGGQTLRLKRVPMRLFVQQITPLPPGVAGEYQPLSTAAEPRRLQPADSWGRLAGLNTTLDSEISAGEVENLYFRVQLPCTENLRVYVTAWVNKPDETGRARAGDIGWVKQTPLDLSEQCRPTSGKRS